MRRSGHKNHRTAAAAVEFAVVLPLIVSLLLGAIEVGRGVMVCHALQEAANAGCRVYCVEDTTRAQAAALVDQSLSVAGISGYSIQYDPPSKSAVDTPLEPVTVTVSVPYDQVAWLPITFLNAATLRGTCVMPADIDISDGGDDDGYSPGSDDNPTDGNDRDGDWSPGGSWNGNGNGRNPWGPWGPPGWW